MKKLITLLTLSACILFLGATRADAADAGNVQITATTFPDEFFRNYVLDNIDTNKDGILQQEEAEAVTKISFRKFNDADEQDSEDEEGTVELHYYTKDEFTFDFKGLENFTNVTDLTIRLFGGLTKDNADYPVQVSNVSSLYRLKNLKALEINKTNMKNFDCSKFPKLEKLTLTEFGELTKMTFKGNKKLKKLNLSDFPKLSSFDVSSLGKLTSIQLRAVNVKNIKFGKKNSSIKRLDIGSYTNQYCKKLTSLNLSKLTGLKKLLVSWQKNLKKLDVSHNKKLSAIYLEKCNKITTLVPKKNQKLTEVNVWGCKNFKTLDLSANHKLSSLSLEGMIVKNIRLSKKNKLTFFRYANAKLKKFNVKNINTKTLKDLQLYGNKLKKVDIRKYKKLQNLEVDKGVKVVGKLSLQS
ncbi:MAG: hypothetical protein J1F22_02875 [Lachnospiraceae bacterium]|nr:hypothetical protein [Lachnospiraceae bacterium]